MERNWEEFNEGPKDVESGLHVTLSRKGEFTIGAAACRQLGEPAAVVLLFDRATRVMGVRPAHIRAENAYQVHRKLGGSHGVIRAIRFCKHHSLRVDQTVRFRTTAIEDAVLVLDTKTMVNIN